MSLDHPVNLLQNVLLFQNGINGLHAARRGICRLLPALLLCAAPPLASSKAVDNAPVPASSLLSMSLDDLAGIEITSVSKRPEPLSDAAAAIFVITGDDIRRSGATTIPEALRLAPNLQVARINASNYAITARGFNSNTANKLLVLIDGRSIYTPLYSGVLWYSQDLPLADVERIEVISGPGGTLWGANAVNGVINIITKSSKNTQGTLLELGTGNTDHRAGVRYGGSLNERTSFRVYATALDQEQTANTRGAPLDDAIDRMQAGFRGDWVGHDAAFTLQGDAYSGTLEQINAADATVQDHNLLGRWTRTFSPDSELQLQSYVEQSTLDFPGALGEVLTTYDVSLQHHVHAGRHDFVWGGGYRQAENHVSNTAAIAFLPADRDLTLANIFVQDSVALSKRLQLTVGGKLEQNDFTHRESEPNVRLAWKLDERSLLWSAASRAVRTPSLLETDYHVPGQPPYLLAGGPDFVAERLTAYEIGYRSQPDDRFSYSISTFYNHYTRLRSYTNTGFPLQTVNNMYGETSGVELWGSYQVNDWWRLSPGYNYLREVLHFQPGTVDLVGFYQAADDPSHQFSLLSQMNLPHRIELDIDLRTIAALPYGGPKAYHELNARLGWLAAPDLELSLVGSNLLHPRHQEWGNTARASDIGRSVFINARYSLN